MIEKKLFSSRADKTRAATKALIDANPTADPQWVIDQTPKTVLGNVEDGVRRDLATLIKMLEHGPALHALCCEELCTIFEANKVGQEENATST